MAIAFDLVGQQWQRKIIVLGAALVGLAALMAIQPASPEDAAWHEMVDAGLIYTDLDGNELGRLYVRIMPDHPERLSEGARAVNGFSSTTCAVSRPDCNSTSA